jgi:glucokinase
MILAGDIGGTKTRLALFDPEGEGLRLVAERTFPSPRYPDLDPIVAEFLSSPGLPAARGARRAPRGRRMSAAARTGAAGGTRVARACFGVAGPVIDRKSATTNLPWVVDARRLERDLGLPAVDLINDLEANAYGIALLDPDDLAVLGAGAPGAAGNAAIISAGTGLGEAGLYWDGRRHRPFACEGGHASFAPVDELQVQLLGHLRRSQEHVSCERVLSGPGLLNIYAFLRDTGRGEEPPWLAEEMRREDPAAVIARAAMGGRSPLCEQALDLFLSIYGAEAGNLALKLMATGGLYVGGGIAPRIIDRMRGPAFMAAFLAKGRMRPLLERMPVRVILNDRTALLGAARRALLGAEDGAAAKRPARGAAKGVGRSATGTRRRMRRTRKLQETVRDE